MNITFIRHAQTEYNKKGLLQGQILDYHPISSKTKQT